MDLDLKTEEKGFTLIELLVSVAIIAILASVGSVQYSKYKRQVQITAAYQELSILRGAFFAYLADNEELPPDVSKKTIPDGMDKLIPTGLFSRETPIGGFYNWDGLPAHSPPGISIQDPDVPVTDMLTLDRRIDDGNLATGEFQVTGDNHYKLVVRN